MSADKTHLIDEALTKKIIGVFYDVHNELGKGFSESVHENALALALQQEGLKTLQQAPLNVRFRGRTIGEFRVDLLIEDRLVVELKAVSQLSSAHEVQLVNYLKASGLPVGLLLNFGSRPQFKRRIQQINPRSSASIRVQSHVQ